MALRLAAAGVPLLKYMEPDTTSQSRAPKIYIYETLRWCLFTEAMTQFLKITHRRCCEHLHGGTAFLACHLTIESWHPLMEAS